MRTYIKMYGPPLLSALEVLDKLGSSAQIISIVHDPEICIGNRCDRIVNSGERIVGDYDFYFEWLKNPSLEQLNGLIQGIDDALEPLGCKYTVTTKR